MNKERRPDGGSVALGVMGGSSVALERESFGGELNLDVLVKKKVREVRRVATYKKARVKLDLFYSLVKGRELSI